MGFYFYLSYFLRYFGCGIFFFIFVIYLFIRLISASTIINFWRGQVYIKIWLIFCYHIQWSYVWRHSEILHFSHIFLQENFFCDEYVYRQSSQHISRFYKLEIMMNFLRVFILSHINVFEFEQQKFRFLIILWESLYVLSYIQYP